MHPTILLDGQQRLTSLARVMAPDRALNPVPLIFFDVDNDEFVQASRGHRPGRRLIPVTDSLGDASQYGPLLNQAGISRDDPSYDLLYERLRNVNAIRRYELPLVTVESDNYVEVAEIFARVNQGDQKLSKGDLLLSAIAARWPEGVEAIESFSDELASHQFPLDREAMLRLTGLISGRGSDLSKLIAADVTGADLKRWWGETERGLRYAADFLRTECGFPRSALLSSPSVAILPAYLLLRRGGRLLEDEPELLRRWVYTAMAFSLFS